MNEWSDPAPTLPPPNYPALKTGDRLPEFDLLDSHDTLTNLDCWSGQALLLCFYANDAVSYNHTLARLLQDALPRLHDAGLTVVSISTDEPVRRQAFAAEHGITYPLLTDSDLWVCQQYGVCASTVHQGFPVTTVQPALVASDTHHQVVQTWLRLSNIPETVPGIIETLCTPQTP
ncbi:MAG: redoxin domain-containing protein [Cyanobacteria bacterium HKST-UBA04]|nr:redoxin domain-containing protein [Cyanobacteria bacterium HKST-UBA04]